jgi:SAM-dependent methyltransferase
MMDGAVHFQAFVEAHLPAPPGRVLEVGCGRGGLARAIARLGYRVSAIDPEAPVGPIFHAVSLEQFSDSGPFDAVVASLALHHIPDLSGALGKIERLLRPGGRLIVNEHAWDRLDEPTARWYLEQRAATGADAPRSVEQCLAEWAADHDGLHGSAAMRSELDQRFEERVFAWRPYLNRELGDAIDEQAEQDLIEAGAIQATGFRYVGERSG